MTHQEIKNHNDKVQTIYGLSSCIVISEYLAEKAIKLGMSIEGYYISELLPATTSHDLKKSVFRSN